MIPLYRQSFEEARRNNEMEQYHESRKENFRCKEFMDNLVSERYNGKSLPANDIVANTVKEFGYDRTMWVIAATIQSRNGDGRFAIQNREWANSFFMPDSQKYEYGLQSHSGLVDMLAKYVQQQYNSLGLFTVRHCIPEGDYTNQVVVLKAEWLKEEYKTPENQLFLATGGFGCDPNSSGTKIFGKFLNDGEEASVRRYDVCGVISPENLPEWASTKVERQLTARAETNTVQIEDNEDEDCFEM